MMQNNNGRSFHPSPSRQQNEENKRANSVASGDTIISTASSNSPLKRRPLHMKKNFQQVGLHISSQGHANGNQRRAGHGSLSHNNQKYSKFGTRVSPYIKQSGNSQNPGVKIQSGGNTANTDSELYGGKSTALHVRQGANSGIGSGSRNVSVSLAQRQQERRDKERAVLKEVETQKQAVLEKLNKIQSKKFSQVN